MILKQYWQLAIHLFWLGLSLFGLGLWLWSALRWWPGDRFWPVRFVNYIMPWLLLALLPGLVAAGLARRYWVIIPLIGPTFFVSLTFAPLFLPRFNPALAASSRLKVMSHNVHCFNLNTPAIAHTIRREQPDIVLLQELTPYQAQMLQTDLTGLYPETQPHIVYEPAVGQAIISRYPLVSVESAGQRGRAQKVIAATPAGPVAVWNVHPDLPQPWQQNYEQLAALAQEIAAANGPLIVGGDFNATDQSEGYRLVNQYLQNAHWQAGWGFGFSFPAQVRRFHHIPFFAPVIRIDHIFYSHHLFASTAGTLAESGGSDHLPVVAELSVVEH